jgi:hypothetical protein
MRIVIVYIIGSKDTPLRTACNFEISWGKMLRNETSPNIFNQSSIENILPGIMKRIENIVVKFQRNIMKTLKDSMKDAHTKKKVEATATHLQLDNQLRWLM